MLWLTFLHQIFSWHCFCLQNIIKFVRLLLAAVSTNGLKGTCLEYTPNKIKFWKLFPGKIVDQNPSHNSPSKLFPFPTILRIIFYESMFCSKVIFIPHNSPLNILWIHASFLSYFRTQQFSFQSSVKNSKFIQKLSSYPIIHLLTFCAFTSYSRVIFIPNNFPSNLLWIHIYSKVIFIPHNSPLNIF